jgi:hypothetical protein
MDVQNSLRELLHEPRRQEPHIPRETNEERPAYNPILR